MAIISPKYQRAYQREYEKEAVKNALVWMSMNDYLAECLAIHDECHESYSLHEQVSSWLFMLRMKSHFSLISSQLLPKSQSLTLDCDFVFLIWQLIHSVQIIHLSLIHI